MIHLGTSTASSSWVRVGDPQGPAAMRTACGRHRDGEEARGGDRETGTLGPEPTETRTRVQSAIFQDDRGARPGVGVDPVPEAVEDEAREEARDGLPRDHVSCHTDLDHAHHPGQRRSLHPQRPHLVLRER
eukprot:8418955-Heterocapsa_arctica.AAC.1